jgi:undecaprenyl diphosphate synthase
VSENNLPNHVAIIMDGNRRWAKKEGKPTALGHKAGYENFKDIADYCFSLGIKYVTVYAFSTENWKRSQEEVDIIMNLARYVMNNEIDRYKDSDTRVRIIGHKEDYPKDIADKIEEVENSTKDTKGNNVNIAFSYGGHQEVIDAIQSIQVKGEEITEEAISSNLYTAGQPNPELIIRTGGQPRLSNFLMWQSAYSEIYFTDTLWPDFSKQEMDKALEFYKNIKRNFGK